MTEPVPILRDKSADLKRLRRLTAAGRIKLYEVDLEELPKSVPNILHPLIVFDHTRFGRHVFASEDDEERLKHIKRVVSSAGIKDAMTFEASARNGMLYFVTG